MQKKKKDLLTCSRFTMLTSAVFCHPALISFACGVINHDWIVASSTIYQRYQREIGYFFFSDISYHINNAFTFFSRQQR